MNMIGLKLSWVFLYCWLALHSDNQNNDWKLRYDDDQIRAYTRTFPNSKFLEYRIEAEIKSSVITAYNMILDVDNYNVLFPYMYDSKILSSLTDTLHIYCRIKTPFPAKNREGIFQNVGQISSNKQYAKIEISNSTQYLPSNDRLIDITDSYGYWEFNKIDSVTTKIVHQFHSNPGGTVPAWIINRFLIKNPVESIKVLRKLCE